MHASPADLSLMTQAGARVPEAICVAWAWRPPAGSKAPTAPQADKRPDTPGQVVVPQAPAARLFFVAIGVSKRARFAGKMAGTGAALNNEVSRQANALAAVPQGVVDHAIVPLAAR